MLPVVALVLCLTPRLQAITPPWIRVEAESGSVSSGATIQSTMRFDEPVFNSADDDISFPEMCVEASGRRAVKVPPGETITFANVNTSAVNGVYPNRLIVRYGFPKNNLSADLTFLDNDANYPLVTKSAELRATFNGTGTTAFAVDAAKTYQPKYTSANGVINYSIDCLYVKYFYECEVNIDTKINSNATTIVLTNQLGGNAEIVIDYIELDYAPAKLAPLATYTIVDPGDLDDDLRAELASDAGDPANVPVYFFRGTHVLNSELVIGSNKDIRGEGWWYTKLKRSESATDSNIIRVTGKNTIIRNLRVEDPYSKRRQDGYGGIRVQAATQPADNTERIWINNVWVADTRGPGIMVNNTNFVSVTNCRVRNTYADAIHFAKNSSDGTALNNLVRAAGDDGVAMVERTSFQSDNYAGNNLVELTWWGRGLSILGGDNNIMKDNELVDIAHNRGVLIGVERFNKRTVNGVVVYDYTSRCTNFLVQGNAFTRCGKTGDSDGDQFSVITVKDASPNGGSDNDVTGMVKLNVVEEVIPGNKAVVIEDHVGTASNGTVTISDTNSNPGLAEFTNADVKLPDSVARPGLILPDDL